MFSVTNYGSVAQPISATYGNAYLVNNHDSRVNLPQGAVILFKEALGTFSLVLDSPADYHRVGFADLALGSEDEEWPYNQGWSVDEVAEWYPDIWADWLEDRLWSGDAIVRQFERQVDYRWRADKYSAVLGGWISYDDYRRLLGAVSDDSLFWAGDLLPAIREHFSGSHLPAADVLLESYLKATDYRAWLEEWWLDPGTGAGAVAVDLDHLLNGEAAQNALATAVEQHPLNGQSIYSLDDHEVYPRVAQVVFEEVQHPVFGPTHFSFNLEDPDESAVTPTRFEALED